MTLEELTTPATVDEVKAAIYAAIASSGVDTTVWKPGAPTRTMIAGVSIVLAATSKLQALIAKMGFLALSQGDWLSQVALYVYDVERDIGTFATGEVRLDNTGGGVYSGDPGDLIFINTATTKTYRNTEAFSIASMEPDVFVPIEAIEIGSESNATPGQIDDFETPLIGVTVTNPTSVVGRDEETDTELQTRCLAKTGTLSPNGAADAYAYVALTAVRETGDSIGVTRVRTVPLGDGYLDVYVADGTGEIASVDDLAIIDEAIQTQVVPLAVTANVFSAAPITIPVTYELWVRTTSITDGQIQDAVEEALTEFMENQPIGGVVISPASGKVYVSAIETVIGAVRLADIVKVVVTLPAADVGLATDEAPALGTVICTAIHQVPGGLF